MSYSGPQSMLARFVRFTAILGAIATVACVHTQSASRFAATSSRCEGEPYLDIVNRLDEGFDIYANVNGQNKYIGTAGPSDTRFSLVGTPLEHTGGSGYAVRVGARPDQPDFRDQSVTLRRGCDRSVK